jgi:hypothetical protein
MSFLRQLRRFIRIFQRLFGIIESGLVIFFPVVRSGSTVRLCGEFVEFGSFFVRVNWHSVSNPWCPLHLVIFAFSKLFNHVHSPRPATDAFIGELESPPGMAVSVADCWHVLM